MFLKVVGIIVNKYLSKKGLLLKCVSVPKIIIFELSPTKDIYKVLSYRICNWESFKNIIVKY